MDDLPFSYQREGRDRPSPPLPVFRLTFRALPAETAPEIRIRHLLKKARHLGLVAMLAEEIPAPPAEPSEENAHHADPT